MESKDESKEIDIKNRTCYCLDNTVIVWDIFGGYFIYSEDILFDEKLYKEKNGNILIYNISHKTFMGWKPLRIRFDKIDGFIKIYDGTKYLVLFNNHFKYDEVSWILLSKKMKTIIHKLKECKYI